MEGEVWVISSSEDEGGQPQVQQRTSTSASKTKQPLDTSILLSSDSELDEILNRSLSKRKRSRASLSHSQSKTSLPNSQSTVSSSKSREPGPARVRFSSSSSNSPEKFQPLSCRINSKLLEGHTNLLEGHTKVSGALTQGHTKVSGTLTHTVHSKQIEVPEQVKPEGITKDRLSSDSRPAKWDVEDFDNLQLAVNQSASQSFTYPVSLYKGLSQTSSISKSDTIKRGSDIKPKFGGSQCGSESSSVSMVTGLRQESCTGKSDAITMEHGIKSKSGWQHDNKSSSVSTNFLKRAHAKSTLVQEKACKVPKTGSPPHDGLISGSVGDVECSESSSLANAISTQKTTSAKTSTQPAKIAGKSQQAEQRKRERLAHRERMRLEKKAEQEKQKLAKQVEREQKKSVRPGESEKFMIVRCDVGLQDTCTEQCIRAYADEKGVHVDFVDQPLKNTITFSRKTAEECELIVGSSLTYRETDEDYVAVVMSIQDFAVLVKAFTQNRTNESRLHLTPAEYARKVKSVFGKPPTILIVDMETYFKKLENGGSRMSAVEKSQYVTRVEFEEACIDLQLQEHVSVIPCKNKDALAKAIMSFNKAISEAPFKREKKALMGVTSHGIGGYAKVGKDNKGLILVWKKMLLEVQNISVDVSDAIIQLYPSPQHLYEAYKNCSSIAEAKLLLKDVNVRRGTGVLHTSRKIGKEVSQRIHTLFTQFNPDTFLK